MKKTIPYGFVVAMLLGGYACTQSSSVSPDSAARSSAPNSSTATGPKSGTCAPGTTPPHSGTETGPHSGTGSPGDPDGDGHGGPGGQHPPHGDKPHSSTAG